MHAQAAYFWNLQVSNLLTVLLDDLGKMID